jgi:UDP-N-acetylglucosamine 2-epimerase (non-hydrolysing)
MRDSTERPEGLEAGAAVLVGSRPEMIINKTSEILADQAARASMAKAGNPYGDGKAAERIVRSLLSHSPQACRSQNYGNRPSFGFDVPSHEAAQ